METKKEFLEIRVNLAAKSLLRNAEALKRNAEEIIRKINNNELNKINPIGEIQGLGSQVDVSCMELKTYLNLLESEREEA